MSSRPFALVLSRQCALPLPISSRPRTCTSLGGVAFYSSQATPAAPLADFGSSGGFLAFSPALCFLSAVRGMLVDSVTHSGASSGGYWFTAKVRMSPGSLADARAFDCYTGRGTQTAASALEA